MNICNTGNMLVDCSTGLQISATELAQHLAPDRFVDLLLAHWLSFGIAGVVLLVLLIFALSGINVVDQWERRGVLRFGVYVRTLGPGLHWVMPIVHRVLGDDFVNDFVLTMDVPPVQTHDNVPVSASLVLTMRIDPDRVQDYNVNANDGWKAAQRRALATAAEAIGNTELSAILHERNALHTQLKAQLQAKVEHWAVIIVAVELQNIKITDSGIEQAIAMKARAEKEADGELSRAQRQKQIAEALADAAKSMTEDGWRLKNLETLVELARSANNNTILIPAAVSELLRK